MDEWTLLKCLRCDFPFIVHSKEYIEVTNSDYPFMYCPKCGKENNLSEDCFQERSEEHTSELQSRQYLVCRLLLETKHPILSHPVLRLKQKYTTYDILVVGLW